jgi:hypothetical protein
MSRGRSRIVGWTRTSFWRAFRVSRAAVTQTGALLDGSLTPDHVVEDWPDWFQLVPAFVAAYGTDELKEAEVASVFLEAVEEHENVSLDDAVRAYLKALEAWLDVYPEMRTTEE